MTPLLTSVRRGVILLHILFKNSLNLSAFTAPFWYNSDAIHFYYLLLQQEYFLNTSLFVVFFIHLSPKNALQ